MSLHINLSNTKAGDCGLQNEECAFCKQEITFGFAEHYTFCPNCSAIYINMICIKGCDHINDDNDLIAIRPPWFKEIRENVPHAIEVSKKQFCSKCKKVVILDGF